MRVRHVLILATLASLATLSGCSGCVASSSGNGGTAPPSSSSSSSSTSPPVTPTRRAPVAGAPCTPGPDSIACEGDGVTEVTCGGSVWRALQTCRGAGGCKGVGSALACAVGQPLAGDPCMPANAPGSCRSATEISSCVGNVWRETTCPAGQKCQVSATGGQPVCK